MKNLHLIAIVTSFFIHFGCEKHTHSGKWNIKIEDENNLYNYNGNTYNPANNDAFSPTFTSKGEYIINGSNIAQFVTRSDFKLKLGNISQLNFSLIFSTTNTAMVVGLNPINTNPVRLAALKNLLKTGIYNIDAANSNIFNFYSVKSGEVYVPDSLQNSIIEIVSVNPNKSDGAADGLITQINFTIALRGITFTGTKKIKGTIFSFFNLN